MLHTPIAELTIPDRVPGVPDAVIITHRHERDRDGMYPACIVLAKRENPIFSDRAFSTHEVYFNDDRGKWFSQAGHYDLTEAEGLRSFSAR